MPFNRRNLRLKSGLDRVFAAFLVITMVATALFAFDIGAASPIRWLQTPMYVERVSLTQDSSNPDQLTGSVFVRTQGNPVSSARVVATVTGPGNASTRVDARTNNQGRADFSIAASEAGDYSITVNNVQKLRHRYEPNRNLATSASISVDGTGATPIVDEPGAGDGDGNTDGGSNEQPPSPPQSNDDDHNHGSQGTGACGESMSDWHPPVVNGCETGHEHGDAPPQWIADAGYTVSFHGHFNTSPTENTIKHASMKGFSTTLNDVDIYFRVHAASNVLERSARFHSYEVWARDPSGNVSHWQGWYNSGNPETDRIPRTQGDPGRRPVVLVVDQASWDAGIKCEQWYGHTARWSWDFGWTICNSQTIYYPGENSELGVENWIPTGDPGTNRRLEAAWYGGDSVHDPSRDIAPKDQVFWATQFGQIVSGPNDPVCSATTNAYGQTYENVCLEQYIASTMTAVEFPGNAEQKQFPSTGVTVDGTVDGTPPVDPPVDPTAEPTEEPTQEPTAEPTAEPTQEPTEEPTQEPTAEPTEEPTQEPTVEPTAEPTEDPDDDHNHGEPTPVVDPPVGNDPVAGQPCPAWVHDRHVAVGPDGNTYPTWHPPVDPQYGCTFNHEHGDNPNGNSAMQGRQVVFGYLAQFTGMTMPHEGYKVFAWQGIQSSYGPSHNGASTVMVLHQGTSGAGRFTLPHHDIEVHYINPNDGREIHAYMLAPFGQLLVGCGANDPGMVLRQQQASVGGARQVAADKCFDNPNIPYEDWITSLYIGRDSSGNWKAYMDPHFAIFNPNTYCIVEGNSCKLGYSDERAGTGEDPLGPDAWFKGTKREAYLNQVWIENRGGDTTIWTDAYGRLVDEGSPGAIPQYVSGVSERPMVNSTAWGANNNNDPAGAVRAPN